MFEDVGKFVGIAGGSLFENAGEVGVFCERFKERCSVPLGEKLLQTVGAEIVGAFLVEACAGGALVWIGKAGGAGFDGERAQFFGVVQRVVEGDASAHRVADEVDGGQFKFFEQVCELGAHPGQVWSLVRWEGAQAVRGQVDTDAVEFVLESAGNRQPV